MKTTTQPKPRRRKAKFDECVNCLEVTARVTSQEEWFQCVNPDCILSGVFLSPGEEPSHAPFLKKISEMKFEHNYLVEALVRITKLNSPDILGLGKVVRKMRSIARGAVPNYVQLGKKYDKEGRLKKKKFKNEDNIWDQGISIPSPEWLT